MKCAAPTCKANALNVFEGLPLCLDHITAVRLGAARRLVAHADPTESLVYYAHRPDTDRVKIGVSQNLHKRIRQLSSMAHPVHVLAVEPGGYHLERKRHTRFKTLRLVGSEWFRAAPQLMSWIDRVVSDNGQPYCNCPAASGGKCPAGF